MLSGKSPDLEFSKKYSQEHSQAYRAKHSASFSRRLSNVWEHRMARKALALAGNPMSVLDLPCGAGRFWAMLAEAPKRKLYAADNSENMLAVANQNHQPVIRKRYDLFQTSVFAIALPDNAVESIFCMRLLHHIGQAEHRLQIYQEFHRVTCDTVCLSLWVDGNYKAKRRRQLDERRNRSHYQNRFVLERTLVESEFLEAGFNIVGKVDFLPYYAMWRTYVLRKR